MFSLVAEFLALILLILLAIHFYEPRQVRTYSGRRYWHCLILVALSILSNGLCVFTLAHGQSIPIWVNLAVNTAYFFVCILMCAVFGTYLFEKLLAHVHDPFCMKRATKLIWGLFGLLALLMLINIPTGLVFSIGPQGEYCRGPLNAIYFIQAPVELGMLIMCYRRHLGSVDKGMRRVVKLGSPLVVALVVYQIFFPEVLLNGTIGAYMALLLFLNFQSQKIDMDPLTQVGNRNRFLREIDSCLQSGQYFQVAAVTLSQFRAINSRMGYHKGDEVLYSIASWMEDTFPSGKVFRFSPVTFVVLHPGINNRDGDTVLEKLRERFGQPWSLGKYGYTVSAQVVELRWRGEKWDTVRVVEILEYIRMRAKQDGKSLMRFDKATVSELERQQYLLEYVRESVEQRRFQVWYQPVYCVSTGRYCSAEALVRLQDFNGSYISPAEFIPLAEMVGLVSGVNRQVMEKVCSFLGAHKELSLLGISVNLSMSQIAEPDFVDGVKRLLSEHSIPKEILKLEITERMLLGEDEKVQAALKQLADEGFHFFLDDFGIGYSNFSGVLNFPFTTIKLDKSLVDEISVDEKSRLTVATLIELFHRAGMRVVAEGIETRQQAETLGEMGADFFQGFYFARPMPEEDYIQFLIEHNERT